MIQNPVVQSGGTGFKKLHIVSVRSLAKSPIINGQTVNAGESIELEVGSYVNCYWSTEGVDLKDEDGNIIPKEPGQVQTRAGLPSTNEYFIMPNKDVFYEVST